MNWKKFCVIWSFILMIVEYCLLVFLRKIFSGKNLYLILILVVWVEKNEYWYKFYVMILIWYVISFIVLSVNGNSWLMIWNWLSVIIGGRLRIWKIRCSSVNSDFKVLLWIWRVKCRKLFVGIMKVCNNSGESFWLFRRSKDSFLLLKLRL